FCVWGRFIPKFPIQRFSKRVVWLGEFSQESFKSPLEGSQSGSKFFRRNLLSFVGTVVRHNLPNLIVEIELREGELNVFRTREYRFDIGGRSLGLLERLQDCWCREIN